MMSGNRLLRMLWLIVAASHAMRAFAELVAGQNVSEEVTQMLLALALMKLYDMDGDE